MKAKLIDTFLGGCVIALLMMALVAVPAWADDDGEDLSAGRCAADAGRTCLRDPVDKATCVAPDSICNTAQQCLCFRALVRCNCYSYVIV